MTHIEDEAKMIADIRFLHNKVIELHHGVNTLRRKYPDQDPIRYADIDQVREDAEKLRQVEKWLRIIVDAPHDRQRKVA